MTLAEDARLPRVSLAFTARNAPLAPIAVAATGSHAKALATAALRRDDPALAALRGVASSSVLVLLGDGDALPWCDGVVYLGRDPAAPSLLFPTTLAPSLPAALVERAVLRRVAAAAGAPIAVIPTPDLWLVPLAAARPVSRARLRAWLEAAT